jgi:TRAP-type transport system small permease protein
MNEENSKDFPLDHAPGVHAMLEPEEEPKNENTAQLLFEIFCAVIFLGMIGLVFYNAFLRYVFSSSYPPSEEWARFLFIYITFFGAIEAFIYNKHIAVDLLVTTMEGARRKCVDIAASLFSAFALGLLLYGGIVNVLQTLDTNSVATNVNMAFINGTLPIMALVALIVELRALVKLVRRPASTFKKG